MTFAIVCMNLQCSASLGLAHQAIFTIAVMMMCRCVVMVAASIVMVFMSMFMIEYILSIMIQDVDKCNKYFIVMMGYHSMGQYQHIGQQNH